LNDKDLTLFHSDINIKCARCTRRTKLL